MRQHNLARLLTLLADDELWKSLGACGSAETDLFFPISVSASNDAQVAEAKAICARCLVRRECLDFAIQTRQMHGIWGGMTEEERYPAVRAGALKARESHTCATPAGPTAAVSRRSSPR